MLPLLQQNLGRPFQGTSDGQRGAASARIPTSGKRDPPANWVSAKVGDPGRLPSGTPQGTNVELSAGCCGMQRPCASPAPPFVRGRSAPPPAARPQGCCPPRRGALTTHWDSRHSIMMPAATRRAGAAPFPPADGRTRDEAVWASRARTQSQKTTKNGPVPLTVCRTPDEREARLRGASAIAYFRTAQKL